jgi:hypothetical protein
MLSQPPSTSLFSHGLGEAKGGARCGERKAQITAMGDPEEPTTLPYPAGAVRLKS